MSMFSPFGTPVIAEEVPLAPKTLQESASEIALKHGIATTTLFNLIYSESRWDPNAISKDRQDRGIVQINRASWPEIEDSEAFDPIWAMEWASQKIAQGEAYKWVVCNCYSFVKTKIQLPKMAEIVSNSSVPIKNGVIIFNYRGVKHIAYIESVKENGIHIIEANFEPCLIDRRIVDFDDKRIVGYWSPEI